MNRWSFTSLKLQPVRRTTTSVEMDWRESDLIIFISIAALEVELCAELREKWAFDHGLTTESWRYLCPKPLARDFARDMHDDLDALAPGEPSYAYRYPAVACADCLCSEYPRFYLQIHPHLLRR